MFCSKYHLDLKPCESVLVETAPQLVFHELQLSGQDVYIIVTDMYKHPCAVERCLPTPQAHQSGH